MNSIRARPTSSTQAGWSDSWKPALHVNSVDRKTLDAMTEAVIGSLPDFEAVLRAKARITAIAAACRGTTCSHRPGGGRRAAVGCGDGEVQASFGSYSARLEGGRAFDERWVDAEPRAGMAGGAFCMGSPATVRWCCSTTPARSTACRRWPRAGPRLHNVTWPTHAMQRQLPWRWRDASIFCETMSWRRAGRCLRRRALTILDTDLQEACQVVVDIHSRFLFERRSSSGGRSGALSVQGALRP